MNSHAERIKNAEILLKLSLGFSATLPELGYLSSLESYGQRVQGDELKLTKEEEGIGATLLEHVATYTLAVQIDTDYKACVRTQK